MFDAIHHLSYGKVISTHLQFKTLSTERVFFIDAEFIKNERTEQIIE
jgi:hypothetical protein